MSVLNPSYSDAILALVPNAIFVTVNNEITVWDSPEPQPTNVEIEIKLIELNAQVPLANCKTQARQILYETDWTTIPDVANPKNNPYLMNQDEFIAYRNTVRGYAVNPVANPDFPTAPTEQWSS
jgi:hypothetical protein